ncbi:hypothetical protein D932_01026 [Enterococcus casseliflavus 14-MB-W-14]|nr:hypothetical protein D932_01026 [Enterococcus casseliflavus 14-MB-W-14]
MSTLNNKVNFRNPSFLRMFFQQWTNLAKTTKKPNNEVVWLFQDLVV